MLASPSCPSRLMLFKRHVLFPFTGLWEWTSFLDMKGHCDVPKSIFSNSGCTNKLVSSVTPISVCDCFLRCCCAVLLARETALFSPSEDSPRWTSGLRATALHHCVYLLKLWLRFEFMHYEPNVYTVELCWQKRILVIFVDHCVNFVLQGRIT